MAIALQGVSEGFSDYRRSQASVAAGRRLGDKLSLGIRANYHSLKISGYGKAGVVAADIGILLHLTEKVHFGLQLENPVGTKTESPMYVPAFFRAGLGYDPSNKVLVSVELLKEQSQPACPALCIQYVILPVVTTRLRIQSAGDIFLFGVGFSRSAFRIDIYSSLHLRLGMSGGLLLHYSFATNADR